MDALVVGADSRIGSLLLERLEEHYFAAGTSRRPMSGHYQLDLTDQTAQIPFAKMTYICAGMTSFKACDESPWLAWHVNVAGPLFVARQQIERGGRVVFLSSCAAETHPDRRYGALKLEAENDLIKLGGDKVCCVRFGPVEFDGPKYADGPYRPVQPDKLVAFLANLMEVNWWHSIVELGRQCIPETKSSAAPHAAA